MDIKYNILLIFKINDSGKLNLMKFFKKLKILILNL